MSNYYKYQKYKNKYLSLLRGGANMKIIRIIYEISGATILEQEFDIDTIDLFSLREKVYEAMVRNQQTNEYMICFINGTKILHMSNKDDFFSDMSEKKSSLLDICNIFVPLIKQIIYSFVC